MEKKETPKLGKLVLFPTDEEGIMWVPIKAHPDMPDRLWYFVAIDQTPLVGTCDLVVQVKASKETEEQVKAMREHLNHLRRAAGRAHKTEDPHPPFWCARVGKSLGWLLLEEVAACGGLWSDLDLSPESLAKAAALLARIAVGKFPTPTDDQKEVEELSDYHEWEEIIGRSSAAIEKLREELPKEREPAN